MTALRFVLSACLGLTPALTVRPAAADVLSSCVFAMTEVAFGEINVLPGMALTTNGILTIRCPLLATLLGSTLSACISFPTPRRLQGPSTTLNYDFMGPLPATATWSSTTPVQVPLTLLLNGGTVSVTIPAAILAGQATALPAAYSSTVTATVAYGLPGCSTGVVYHTSFSFLVDATLVSVCTVSADAIDFGSSGHFTSTLDAQGRILTQCTVGTSYTIGLDGGRTGASDPTNRQMRPVSGASSLRYGLYRDSARTLGWGNTPGVNTIAGTGTALTQVSPVYARTPIQATPSPGSYSDNIVITTTY